MLQTFDRIFDGSRSLDAVVALSPEGPRSFGEFQRLALGVAHRAQGGGRWVLACEDAFAFAAGLIGLLQARATILLPPNQLPATLDKLKCEADGLLSDALVFDGGDPQPPCLSIQDADMEFWTSGSTEEPKRVRRRFSQMAAEVEILESLFGHMFQGGPVLGTVPHHHIYGCLFRILWPLATGRPFVTEAYVHPEHLASAFAESKPPVLVSSPAYLSRLPRLLDLDRIQPKLSAVFSSGGPLVAEDARVWRQWVPTGVIEVYGSTESGGIAWRSQGGEAHGEAWKPFPDVALDRDQDGALLLRSKRVQPEGLRMEDAVEFLPDGRFRLLGRLDRVAKLEEKRVSLPELEAHLSAHPWVHQAAVVPLEGPRRVLGAVLVLEPHAGGAAAHDRKALLQAFRIHLSRRFESVVIPKRWRFVNELPYNERGKLEARALAALFEI